MEEIKRLPLSLEEIKRFLQNLEEVKRFLLSSEELRKPQKLNRKIQLPQPQLKIIPLMIQLKITKLLPPLLLPRPCKFTPLPSPITVSL